MACFFALRPRATITWRFPGVSPDSSYHTNTNVHPVKERMTYSPDKVKIMTYESMPEDVEFHRIMKDMYMKAARETVFSMLRPDFVVLD